MLLPEKNVGHATIKASTQNGELYASYNVTVTEKMIRDVNISNNTLSATLENVFDENYDKVTLIIAIYNNAGALYDTKTITVEDFVSGYCNSIQEDFEEISDDSYVKIFVWDSLNDMKPLSVSFQEKISNIPHETVSPEIKTDYIYLPINVLEYFVNEKNVEYILG